MLDEKDQITKKGETFELLNLKGASHFYQNSNSATSVSLTIIFSCYPVWDMMRKGAAFEVAKSNVRSFRKSFGFDQGDIHDFYPHAARK